MSDKKEKASYANGDFIVRRRLRPEAAELTVGIRIIFFVIPLLQQAPATVIKLCVCVVELL